MSLFLSSNGLKAQETVVFDREIDWQWTLGEDYGGNTFYWWHRVEYGINVVDYGDMSPTDWTSPYNYRNGSFYVRFEVIEQPTTEAFKIQFGIWQNLSGQHTETMSDYSYLNGGAGSVSEKNVGSPAGWWQKVPASPVDFTRPEDYYRVGIVLWQQSPSCLPMAQGWNNSNACADASTVALKFFPMRARVTVVAVASGHSFSGWENYREGGTQPPLPNYGIDYINETTDKVVPATDEYSTSSNMAGATSGTGQKVGLVPGVDMYFRTKENGAIPASPIQHLVIKDRPLAPTYTIDYHTERTEQNVSSWYEFAVSEDFSDAVQGSNQPVAFPPGTRLYLRKWAVGDNFDSYVQTLESGSRGEAPSFTVNYLTEATHEAVDEEFEYSLTQDFALSTPGTGVPAGLAPGITTYFRKRSTDSTYSSHSQPVVVAARPDGPVFSIDYVNETTVEPVPASVIYSATADFQSSSTGTGMSIPVQPGIALYFKSLPTETTYLSEYSMLEPPQRQLPAVGINYFMERTNVPISSDYIHSENPDMSNAVTGTGAPLNLLPGTTVYIQRLPGFERFRSQVQALVVPGRPQLALAGGSPVTTTPVEVGITFPESVTGFTVDDIAVSNGSVDSLTGSYTAYITPFSSGNVTLHVPANVVNEGNFSSFTLGFNYVESTSVPPGSAIPVRFHFSQPEDLIYLEIPVSRYDYEVMDMRGSILRKGTLEGGEHTLSTTGFAPGLYLLRISSGNQLVEGFKFLVQ